MRCKRNNQDELSFAPAHLRVTRRYYRTYENISRILDENREVVDLVHRDLRNPSKYREPATKKQGWQRFSSDTVLRVLLVQVIEGLSLRQTVVRVDDSDGLRRFTRIHNGAMMDFSTLDKLKNSIRPETWKKINRCLARHAAQKELISAEDLRLDTTAVETNIHYPSDSALMWDVYQVLARLIRKARDLDLAAVGNGRLHCRRAKKLTMRIRRITRRKGRSPKQLQTHYERLIREVERILDWATTIASNLSEQQHRHQGGQRRSVEALVNQSRHFVALGLRVVDQSRRRVLCGESVPNDDKIFSIFEEHTELLKRGKAGKPIEFGHMIQLEQVREKFITGYAAFDKRPVEHQLIHPALKNHQAVFGQYPDCITADRAYWENQEAIDALAEKVPVVSIGKNGKPNNHDLQRESDPEFREGQRFRAGVEGTISFIKRSLRLARCFNKGWTQFVCTVGAAIFAHNLLNLARA